MPVFFFHTYVIGGGGEAGVGEPRRKVQRVGVLRVDLWHHKEALGKLLSANQHRKMADLTASTAEYSWDWQQSLAWGLGHPGHRVGPQRRFAR